MTVYERGSPHRILYSSRNLRAVTSSKAPARPSVAMGSGSSPVLGRVFFAVLLAGFGVLSGVDGYGCACSVIAKVRVTVPVKLPMPVKVTLAVPTSTLLYG